MGPVAGSDPGERAEARRDHTQGDQAVSGGMIEIIQSMEGWRE
jgi:hypothetical protein